MLQVISSANELASYLNGHRASKHTVGLIPTMGALHQGHIHLVEESVRQCDVTVVSIFVNPTQFNEKQDFTQYPRNVDDDVAKLKNTGCEVVFVPTVDDIYPNGTNELLDFQMPVLMDKLEAEYRPGHMTGVVTVVMRFFDLVKPQKAYFGLKDYQQYLVIKHSGNYYGKGVDVVGVPTVREKNGLAMSSRNLHLSEALKNEASLIWQIISSFKKKKGNESIEDAQEAGMMLLAENGFQPEYLQVCDTETLIPVKDWNSNENYVVLCAAKLNGVRLIDNTFC